MKCRICGGLLTVASQTEGHEFTKHLLLEDCVRDLARRLEKAQNTIRDLSALMQVEVEGAEG